MRESDFARCEREAKATKHLRDRFGVRRATDVGDRLVSCQRDLDKEGGRVAEMHRKNGILTAQLKDSEARHVRRDVKDTMAWTPWRWVGIGLLAGAVVSAASTSLEGDWSIHDVVEVSALAISGGLLVIRW